MGVSVRALFALVLLAGCKPPPLTEAMVIEELGRDETYFTFYVLYEPCIGDVGALCRGNRAGGRTPESVAARGAGWTEEACPGAPDVLQRLTPAGRSQRARWRTFEEPKPACNSLQPYELVVARYERTGAPVVRPGENENEKLVTIPGRWIPNEDGTALVKAGYPRLTVVDRVETYTFWRNRWARHHAGD